MNRFASKYIFLLSFLLALISSSCRKDSFITSPDATISTSADSLKYDTVFTSIGSITQSFKINNNNDQKLLLSNITVMGGTASAFKININGVSAQEVNNIELAANDSMYIFVSVHINPNLDNLPFIVKDSIQISYNGNTRFIQLEAFGQNANFLRNRIIDVNTTWNNRLPYVILDRLQIDTNVTLTLDPGCKIYCHADAPVLVDGTLKANGTKDQPVIFRGDRVDEDYKDLPASWPGIYFRATSKTNELTFTEVRNAYQAIVAENPASNFFPKVTLHQCIIDNAYDAGLLCVNSSLYADNSLISNCGNNVNFILGGNYNLTNCTVASYSTYISHKNPVLSANNFAMINGAAVTTPLDATFENCIFWGDDGLVENEVVIAKQGTGPFTVTFNKCLYKAATDPSSSTINDCIRNQNPLFDSVSVSKRFFDFHINNNAAPGINYGNGTIFSADLDGNNRSNGLPDLGCYEKQ
jgi:hypothetical protein